MDTLIRLQATGARDAFAAALDISVSTLHQDLEQLRGMGAVISYSRRKQTYLYQTDQRLYLGYYPTPDA